jgi:hypothetical protein
VHRRLRYPGSGLVAAVGAVGVAVIAVLTLRAMGEWPPAVPSHSSQPPQLTPRPQAHRWKAGVADPVLPRLSARPHDLADDPRD